MRFIYLDNIRGFQNTYIPIADINFLVGENSTGKSSVLELICLLGSPSFWFTQEFNTDEVEFGNFQDIVSIKSQNKTYFKIGVIDCHGRKQEHGAFLMTFKKKDGLPVISTYNYIFNKREIRVKFTEKIIKYKIVPIPSGNEIKKRIVNIFNNWTNKNDDDTGYKLVKSKIPYNRRTVLGNINSIMETELSDSDMGRSGNILALPSFTFNFAWIAPIRSKPKSIYDSYKIVFSPEGDHTPYLIKKILEQKSKKKGNKRGKKENFIKFINQFGKESGLFDTIKIREYGKSSATPFAINIVTGGKQLKLNRVGYGVSQALPVIVELFIRGEETWFAVQQPEVHLHPKAQVSLGDLIFNLAVEEKKHFFVETHSDYMIDRFRLNYKKDGKAMVNSQILFFEKNGMGNNVSSIEIMDNGEYSENQPDSFREFFIKEELSLLGL